MILLLAFGCKHGAGREYVECMIFSLKISNKKKSTNIHPLYKYLPTTTPKWIKPEKIRVEFVCQTRGVKRFACLSC